jgi:ribosomal protein L37AE/L43A
MRKYTAGELDKIRSVPFDGEWHEVTRHIEAFTARSGTIAIVLFYDDRSVVAEPILMYCINGSWSDPEYTPWEYEISMWRSVEHLRRYEVKCPLCDHPIAKRVAADFGPEMYQCDKCGSIHGIGRYADIRRVISNDWAGDPCPPDRMIHYDIDIHPVDGPWRIHGWVDPEQKDAIGAMKIVQTG